MNKLFHTRATEHYNTKENIMAAHTGDFVPLAETEQVLDVLRDGCSIENVQVEGVRFPLPSADSINTTTGDVHWTVCRP